MPALHGKSILLIDDAADVLLLAKKILETDGARTFEASSAHEGLKLAQANAPSLIITDLEMPTESGFDFLKQKMSDESIKDIPVLVLSGLNDRESVYQALALGAVNYVLKPLRSAELLQRVRKTLLSKTFKSHRFPPSQRPAATIIVGAEVNTASEIGFTLESPVKLEADASVKVSGALFDILGCPDAILRTTQKPSEYLGRGRYAADINLLGVSEASAKQIRRALKDVA